jgi:PAS domain S-box-containing protein
VLAILRDISDRKRAEQEVLREKALSDGLIEAMPGVFAVVDQDGRLVRWSKATEGVTGYTREEVSPMAALDLVAEENREEIGRKLAGVFTEGAQTAEVTIVTKDGRRIPYYYHGIRIYLDGIPHALVLGIDISDRVKAEEALRLTQHSVDDAQNIILWVRPDGRFLYVNNAACRALGYTQEEMLDLSVSDVDVNWPAERWEELIAPVKEAGEAAFESLLRRKDGTLFPVLVSISCLKYAGDEYMFASLADISDRVEAEDALRESEEAIRAFVETSQDWIWAIDLQGRHTYSNLAVEGILGYGPDELVGKESFALMHEEDRRRIEEHLPQWIAEKTGWRNQVIRWRHKDGSWRWLESNAVPILTVEGELAGFRGVDRDITERKRAEDALRLSETNLTRAQEIGHVGSWHLDIVKGKLIWTAETYRIFGVPIGEPLTYEAFLGCVHPDDRDFVHRSWSASLRGAPYDIEHRLLVEGKTKWVREKAEVELSEDGAAIAAVGTVQDITEAKRTHELLIQTEKMATVGGLAAGVAHEINNPLAGIVQSTQNVLNRLSPEQPKSKALAGEIGIDLARVRSFLEQRGILSFLEGIRDAGGRAAEIVENMLRFSRGGVGTHAPAVLSQVIDRAISLAEHDYDMKKRLNFRDIEIVREYDAQLPPVPCTAPELQQVLLNLLGNAAQSLAVGSGGQAPRIVLRTATEGEMARIDIQDNGPGMDAETQRRIFEPFFTTRDVGEGTGLGLFVSYFIITNNHRGTIEVSSAPGEGATFTVRLPLKEEV